MNHDCSYGCGKCGVHTSPNSLLVFSFFLIQGHEKEIHDSIEHHRLVIFNSLGISVGGSFVVSPCKDQT